MFFEGLNVFYYTGKNLSLKSNIEGFVATYGLAYTVTEFSVTYYNVI